MPRAKSEVEPRPIGWTDTVDRFSAHLESQERSPNTIRVYRHDLQLFQAWYHSSLDDEPELATIAAQDLREWKSSMLDRNQAPQSVNRRLCAVQSLLKWARSREWCQGVETPKLVAQVAPRPKWLDRKEENALVRAVKERGEARDVALVTLLLHAGLRIHEAAAARWGSIEIAPRSGAVAVIGKGRKHRSVPLDSDARAALTHWSEVSGPGLGTDRHVFEGRKGPPTPKWLGKVVSRYGDRMRPRLDLTAHVLRHTCCRRWIESGLHLEDVAALAGHESIETTRLYVEPGQADLQALVERRCGDRAEPETDRPAAPPRSRGTGRKGR